MDGAVARAATKRLFGEAAREKLALLGAGTLFLGSLVYQWRRAFICFYLLPQPWLGDFSTYYELAFAMRKGLNPYRVNLNVVGKTFGLLPLIEHSGDAPTFILCFVPLTLFSAERAYLIWMAANVAALLVSVLLLFGPSARIGWRRALPLALLAVTFAPVTNNFEWAQTAVLLLLGFIVFMRLVERRRDWAAGAVLAAMGLLRIFPLAMGGYLLARRRWRAVTALAVSFAVGSALTAVLAGLADLRSFADMSLGLMNRGSWPGSDLIWSLERISLSSANVSFDTFVSRMFYFYAGTTLPAGLVLAQHAIIASAKLVLLAVTFRETISDEDRDHRAFSLWIVTMLLLSPMVWLHYMVLLLIPFAQMTIAEIHGRTRRRTWFAAVVSYCFVLLTTPAMLHIGGSSGAFSLWSEIGFLSLFSAYVTAYLFAAEEASDRTAVLGGISGHECPRSRLAFEAPFADSANRLATWVKLRSHV